MVLGDWGKPQQPHRLINGAQDLGVRAFSAANVYASSEREYNGAVASVSIFSPMILQNPAIGCSMYCGATTSLR